MSDQQTAMESLFGKPTSIVMSRVPNGSGRTFRTVATLFEGDVQRREFVLEVGVSSRTSFVRAAEFAKAFGLTSFWDAVTRRGPIPADLYPDSQEAFDYARALIETRHLESVLAARSDGTTRHKI